MTLMARNNPEVTEANLIKVFGVVLLASIMANMVVALRGTPVVAADVPEPYGTMWLFPAGHIINVSYGEDEEPEYVGEAMPGTLDTEAAWRTYRYTYVLVDDDLEAAGLRYAEGNTNFDKVWDDREDYEYS